ncbi:hypothetical protein ANCDUO_18091 [Ancylostoma duodenale]|uniref:Uncharacterized protein n=1 Tax=Ancylostoma duodenale TaxID=51022 RepID=A0A0C2CPV5_9BILA|nr:hypothetical protein ANCDUO_18091 [Ancylostoma duodenale]
MVNSTKLVRARQLAAENGGFFMNQFGNADKAEEFHESGDFPLESVNLFHEILVQLQADELQEVKVPHYFVHAAGTGELETNYTSARYPRCARFILKLG